MADFRHDIAAKLSCGIPALCAFLSGAPHPFHARGWRSFIILALALFVASLACYPIPSMQPPPTAGPFPVASVRQVTDGYVFYQDLRWSPDGKYIAATQCPLVASEPDCINNEETILIAIAGGEVRLVDFSSHTPNRVTSMVMGWTPEGERLLLLAGVAPTPELAPISETTSTYFAYHPSTDSFEELEIPGFVISYDPDTGRALTETSDDRDNAILGWYSLESGEFKEEARYSYSDGFLGVFSLSPDGKTLLIGDRTSIDHCEKLYTYALDSHEPFQLWLTGACHPAWSEDGSKLAYVSVRFRGDPNARIVIANADGSDPQPLFQDELRFRQASPTWSPDGTQIAFTYASAANANAIYIADVPAELQP